MNHTEPNAVHDAGRKSLRSWRCAGLSPRCIVDALVLTPARVAEGHTWRGLGDTR